MSFKRSISHFSILTLAACIGVGANAQTSNQANPDAMPMPMHGQEHRPDPARQTQMMTKRLALTPEQAAQVEPILVSRRQQMEALHANASADPKTMHAQHQAIMEDTDQKLNAIFNDQQKQQYAAMKAKHHHGPHGDHGAAAGPAAGATPPAAM